MSAEIKINTDGLNRKLAQIALLGEKGLRDALRDGARRFVSSAVRNTMPMKLNETPATARRNWNLKITQHHETHRVSKKGYVKYADMRRTIAYKKGKLGRMAAGWNAAASVLKAPRIPAWVKRHGAKESSYIELKRGDKIILRLSNYVSYASDINRKRAQYALSQVEKGFGRNLKFLKRKLFRSVK